MSVDLIIERERITDELNKAKLLFKERGYALAEAERLYRMAKARMILQLKMDGLPATLIIDIVKGDENVSLLAFKRDCALVAYKSLVESININKLQLKVNESDIESERRGI